jgi:hypothetical protein
VIFIILPLTINTTVKNITVYAGMADEVLTFFKTGPVKTTDVGINLS